MRGYVTSVGLDADEWIERYIRAYNASGEMTEDDRNWTAFATNVARRGSNVMSKSRCASAGY